MNGKACSITNTKFAKRGAAMNYAFVIKSVIKSSASRATKDGLNPLRWIFLLLLVLVAQPGLASSAAVGSTPGSFRVSESGAAVYTIPIVVPPGTAGMAPNLSLTYSSQSGNGILGMGWSLSGLSAIYRCPASIAQDGFKGGVNFDGNDRFCLDGQRLVAVKGSYAADATEYRTETESYTRIISYGSAGKGPASFKAWTKSGQIIEYGNTADSRIEAQGKATVRLWNVNKISDTKGNYIAASYTEDNANGEFYINRIDYTGNVAAGVSPYASVQFSYEARSDIESGYEVGSTIKNSKRISNINSYAGAALIKNYKLAYNQGIATSRSRLQTFYECDGQSTCLSPITIAWKDSPGLTYVQKVAKVVDNWNGNYVWSGDFDADGKSDVLSFYRDNLITFFSNGDGTYSQIVTKYRRERNSNNVKISD